MQLFLQVGWQTFVRRKIGVKMYRRVLDEAKLCLGVLVEFYFSSFFILVVFSRYDAENPLCGTSVALRAAFLPVISSPTQVKPMLFVFISTGGKDCLQISELLSKLIGFLPLGNIAQPLVDKGLKTILEIVTPFTTNLFGRPLY